MSSVKWWYLHSLCGCSCVWVNIVVCEIEEFQADSCDVCVKDPLNSSDDVSDADPTEVFDAENVIVCQFDKVWFCPSLSFVVYV